jgi:hypothetical protein
LAVIRLLVRVWSNPSRPRLENQQISDTFNDWIVNELRQQRLRVCDRQVGEQTLLISIMRFVVAGFIWLVIAIVLGASGATQRIKPPGPQLIIVGLLIALLAAYAISARFREWLRQLDLRALIALHLT